MKQISTAIRAKEPPAQIDDAKAALEALDRLQQYAAMSHSAFTLYMQHPGTSTGNAAHERSDKYDDVSGRWGDVLRDYLTRLAAPAQS